MKRICTLFLIICMLFTANQYCIAAEEKSQLTITSVDVDYGTNRITIDCKTTAGYLQRITAVIYDVNKTSPDWNNYIRAGEGVTDKNGECTLNLILGPDMTEKVYNVEVNGSGLLSKNSQDNSVLHIIPLNEAPERLAVYNSANSNDLDALFRTDVAALKIEMDAFYENNKEAYLATVISVRTCDYKNGMFPDLTQVAKTFNTTRELIKLGQCSSAASVGQNLVNNAELFGINAVDTDYIRVKDTADNLFFVLNKTEKASNLTEVRKKFKEALAVAMVNNSDVLSLDTVLKKYKETLGIQTSMATYNSMTSADKMSVVRQLTDKSFTNALSVGEAFSNAVTLVARKPIPTPVDSGGGGGGMTYGGQVTSGMQNTTDNTPYIFSDMPQFAWAAESINELYKRGIVIGYGDGTFGGNRSVTRSEFAKMVVTAFGVYDKSASCSFSDVADDNWACSFIGSAVKRGIVWGRSDGTFGAGETITREDAVVMIYRAANAVNMELTGEDERKFSDFEIAAEYSREAVRILSKAGVISGFENGCFEPKLPLTRAQSAKIIYELIKRA